MKKIEPVDVTFAFTDGGLGDNVARLSAMKYCIENYPHVRLRCVVPSYFKPFASFILPKASVYTTDEYQAFMKLRIKPIITIRTDRQSSYTIIRSNLIDHAFHVLLDYQPDGYSYKNYVKYPVGSTPITHSLPTNYIVIPIMYTAKVREFPSHVVTDIVKYAQSRNLTTVFLGKSEARCSAIEDAHIIKGNTDVDLSQGINLIDKTTLPEATEIMARAKAVITLDSGLGHLAATTDAPLIIGYTTVEPHQRNPQRNDDPWFKLKNVVPNPRLNCKFCQSKMNFVFKHDFRECFYEHYNCIKRMESSPWVEALKDILDNNWDVRIYE